MCTHVDIRGVLGKVESIRGHRVANLFNLLVGALSTDRGGGGEEVEEPCDQDWAGMLALN